MEIEYNYYFEKKRENIVILENEGAEVKVKNKSPTHSMWAFNLHKNFFEQLWRMKEIESLSVTVSTIPKRVEMNYR